MKNPVNPNTPFGELYNKSVSTNVNGVNVNTAMVQLVTMKSSMRLFVNGMIPYRGFRLKDVKEYYGVKGDKQSVYNQLCDMVEAVKEYEIMQSAQQ